MIVEYKSPLLFIEDSEHFLEKKEIENNLILGICNGFADKTQVQEGCVFINAFSGSNVKAASIKTAAKAIIAGEAKMNIYIKELADYYRENHIDLKGVFGENFYVNEFSEFYGKQQFVDMVLIVHRLTTVNKFPLAPGKFEMANSYDVDLIAEWSMTFEDEKNPAVRKSKEQVLKITQSKIASGDVFKWTDKGNVVCIAAINRKTKNAGIVGLVYTPKEYRRNGYATSHVQKLSEYILQNGFKYCGLFTDKANPTSNHIYKKIGYMPITEFMDIGYK
jgi:predicted GNAT family acetyltransferase